MTDTVPPLSSPPVAPATPEIRVVEPARAIEWLKAGWALFVRNPGGWIALAVIWMVLFGLASAVPVIGHVAVTVVTPVLTAGALSGCRRMALGGNLDILQVLEGFQRNTSNLLVLGALLFGGAVIITVVSMFLAGGGVATGALMGDPVSFGAGMFSGMLLAFVGFAVMTVPLAMAGWLSPALVMFNDVPPVEALKTSFMAALRNLPAAAIFGTVAFVLSFVAMMPFGLGMLVMLPVMMGATWTAYTEIFNLPAEDATT